MNTESSYPAYRPDIDGLRAIAVGSVLIYHALPQLLPSGFIGVDIFFVISGYLISTIIIRNTQDGRFSFKDFYARRIKRIIPALLVVLIACLLFGWIGLLADEFKQLGAHVTTGIGFVANLMLWSESGYFDSSSETKPLLHLWSLGIEEQFYIIWPIIIGILVRKKIALLPTILLLTAASFALNLYMINVDLVSTFYLPFTRAWELLIGALLAYYTITRNQAKPQPQKTLVPASFTAALGMALLMVGFIFINDEKAFPGWWALLPVSGAALLIASGPHTFINRYCLANPVFVWIGLISYPLYLWHWPLLSMSYLALSETPPVLVRASLILVSVVLAWLTFRFIEKPIRTGLPQVAVTKLLVALMIVVALCGSVVWYKDGFPGRSAVADNDFTPEVAAQFMGPLWKYTSNEECQTQHPFSKAESYKWWFCIQSKSEGPSIALLGDSYANQLYPGFINNSRLANHSILSIGTCDVAYELNFTLDPAHACYGNKVPDQNAFIDNLVSTSPTLKYIVLSGLSAEPDAAYVQRLLERIAVFRGNNRRVILFSPHLRAADNPKSCFSRPFRQEPNSCAIDIEKRNEVNESFQPLVEAVQEVYPDVLYFDQNVIFCSTSACSGVAEGMPLHRDMGHISEYASIALQTYFTRWAENALAEILEN